jgi:hypothetical protein
MADDFTYDEDFINDYINAHNRALVGDPPEGVPVTLEPPARHWREWRERVYGPGNRVLQWYRAQRVAQARRDRETE